MSARKFMGVASVLEELERESDEEDGFLSELEEDEIIGDLSVDGTEYILPVCQKLRKLSSLLPREQDSLLLLDSEAEPNVNEMECDDGIDEEIGDEQIDSLTRLQGKHFPYMQPRRGRCKVCGSSKNTNGKIKDTKVRSYCPKCNVSLCIGNCFELYHTKTAI